MFKLSYEEIIHRIKQEKGLTREEIENKINEKVKQLSDLISKEGAAHIIANQLGIKLEEVVSNKILKINEIPKDVSSVNTAGKVLAMYGVREYVRNGRPGKVSNFLIGDGTGSIRVVAWDENIIQDIEKEKFKVDDVIKIRNGYSRENNGGLEVHLGSKSQVNVNPEDVKINDIKYTKIGTKRKEIKDLGDNDYAQIYGTVVQMFEPRYYHICPNCSKKVFQEDPGFRCVEHGIVKGKEVPVVNFYLDDGTSSIRAVAFRDQAEIILGEKRDNFEELKMEVLGKQLLINGRVNRNTSYDNRMEFIANDVKEANPEELFMER